MLNESRLLSFISSDAKFSLNFLEGQKLIQDLAITHKLKNRGFSYFRDIVLTIQPLITLLKNNESFGVYIDSEIPYFRFKIEMNRHGQIRTLLFPESFDEYPTELTGLCRLAKTRPKQDVPYTSIVELKKTQVKSLSNLILNQSYQLNGSTHVSVDSDQTVLLTKLPTEEGDDTNVDEEWQRILREVQLCFRSAFNADSKIIQAIEKLGYKYLSGTDVILKCNCSEERMLLGIKSLARGDLNNVFEDKDQIETKCDYCHKTYQITRHMLSH